MNNKLIIGTANFFGSYGILQNKVKSLNEIIKFCNKKKIYEFDISNTYKIDKKIIKNLNKNKKNKFHLKLKFDTSILNKNSRIKNIINFLTSFNIRQIETISLHHFEDLKTCKKDFFKIIENLQAKNSKIKIGISIYEKKEFFESVKLGFQIVQLPINIFNQSFLDREIIEIVRRKKIQIHGRSLFMQGILLSKNNQLPNYFFQFSDIFTNYENILNKFKISKMSYNLNFFNNQKWIKKLIVGVNNLKQLKEICSANKVIKKKINYSQNKSDNIALIDPRNWKPKSKLLNADSKLWNKAKNKILNGNMLLSKRPEMFAPGLWPAYYTKSKKCFIWSIDKKKYLDMSLMGVGTNLLGYNNKNVNKAVLDSIKSGNLTTLNNPSEVELAEKLTDIHKWSNKVHFTRSGGEANSVAIRIARASTGSDKIAVCGYHGWHDWYLSANLSKENVLKDHLLDGLSTIGVPKKLSNTVFPFKYNEFNELKKIVNKHDVKIIKMEVSRNIGPKNNFLKKIRNLCDKKNILLIFDECTTGFRENFGGLHLKYGVNPDLAIFGKAIGNGYAINAIIGRDEVMHNAKKTFISSTFWTEKIGPTAAIATLNEMKRVKSWEIVKKTGLLVKSGWKDLAKKYSLDINIGGLDSLANFSFNSKNNLSYKTFISQEMLKQNILASNQLYSCIHHYEYLDYYFSKLDKIFKKITEFENENINPNNFLDGEVCHNTFQRLN